MNDILLGAHESVAGGLYRVFARAEEDGCRAVQLFTRSGRRWEHPPLGKEEVRAFRQAREDSPGIVTLVSHASYLINLASADEELRRRSGRALTAELERCAGLGIPLLVLHPGSAGPGTPDEQGIARVVSLLDDLLGSPSTESVTLCLESTAGQGSALGRSFEQLRRMLEQVRCPERCAVCLDTAHLHAAGYELRTEAGYTATWEAFERELGLERLKVLHLNDTAVERGSRLDRHARIGEGLLGTETFRRLLADPRLAGLPAILETPVPPGTPHPYRAELELLRSLI